MKKIYLIISIFFLISCNKEVEKKGLRVNCGEIVRLYHMSTTQQEGNPCGDDKPGTASGDYAFIVKNDITGNEIHFCINLSEYVRYKLGSIYCDKKSLDGW